MPRRSPQATASVSGGPSNKHADSPSPAFANRLRNRTSIAGSRSSCVSPFRECGSDTSLPRTCAARRGPGLRGQTADARDTGPCEVQFCGSCVVGLYHTERNHQDLGNRLIEPDGHAETAIDRVTCRERLGGTALLSSSRSVDRLAGHSSTPTHGRPTIWTARAYRHRFRTWFTRSVSLDTFTDSTCRARRNAVRYP
jgi:hypothetical protein